MRLLWLLFLSAICLGSVGVQAEPVAVNDWYQQPDFWVQDNDPRLTALAQRLTQGEPLRAAFTQQRHLQAFNRPLISKGALLLLPGKAALLWQQRSPIKETLILTPETFDSVGDDGRRQAMPETARATVAPLLLASLSGNWPVLAKQFVLHYRTRSEQGWQVALVPKADGLLSKAFSVIILTGDNTIKSIVLTGQEGDTTTIMLQSLEPAPLSAQERQWLDE